MWSKLQTALLTMVPQGIRLNDCLFSEPTRFADWKVPKYAGLFVILVKDANWVPKPYQPLYFGDFGNNTPDVPLKHALLPGGASDDTLLISVLPMPFSTTAQRWALRNELMWATTLLGKLERSGPPVLASRTNSAGRTKSPRRPLRSCSC